MKPILAGITGGIGSGKTVVSKIMNVLGHPVYNADDRAKHLLEHNDDVKSSLIKLLGVAAYFPDGTPDRKYIAGVVFNDDKKLHDINAIVHPAVQIDFLEWVAINQSHKLLFKEAAILFESGSFKQMDAIIAVVSPDALRVQRILDRDGKTEEQIRTIISKQLPDEELIKRSDYVIINDGEQLITHQVFGIVDELLGKNSG